MSHLIYIAILPVIFLLSYINKKDLEKEPRGLLFRVFVFGAISTLPICLVELVLGKFFPVDNLPTFGGTFVTVFITISLIEEFGKWIVSYLNVYRRKEFNHSYDGIVYCVFASLGFAAVENILYVLGSGFSTGIMRALLAVPGHAVDAVFMGYFFSKSKEALVKGNNNKSLINLCLSILVPSVIHGIYDGLIFYYTSVENDMLLWIFFIFVIVYYVVALKMVNSLSKVITYFDGTGVTVTQPVKNVNNKVVYNSPNSAPTIEMCVYCGAPLQNGVCTNCGFKKG